MPNNDQLKIIPRDYYLDKLVSRMNNGQIKVITGMRRAGKSFLLFTIFKNYLINNGVLPNHIIEMSFDEYENKKYRKADNFYNWINEQIKDDSKYYVLLDEIQELDDFVSILNSFVKKKNVDIYVTGSNAKNLSEDIVTEFRGRTDQIHLYPLSFKEFYYTCPDLYKEEAINMYLTYGGLPQIVQYQTGDDKKRYLEDIYNETYIRDIKERNHIKDENKIKTLINIVASNTGDLINVSNIANSFNRQENIQIKDQTIKKYLGYLKSAFLIDKVDRYDLRGMKYIVTQSKYYFTDLGIRNVLLNFRQSNDAKSVENLVYNELKIRGYSVDVLMVRSYKRNDQEKPKNLEVDFTAKDFDKQYFIQVCAYLDEEKYEQESASLKEIDSHYKKIIIVQNGLTETHYSKDGILLLKLSDFLLDEDSIKI